MAKTVTEFTRIIEDANDSSYQYAVPLSHRVPNDHDTAQIIGESSGIVDSLVALAAMVVSHDARWPAGVRERVRVGWHTGG